MTIQQARAVIPPPGRMDLVRIVPPGEASQTALFIRDSTDRVLSFGRTPGIAGRFKGLDWKREVFAAAIVLKVRTPQDPVFYELWINPREHDASTAPFVDLAVQPKVIIQFFGDGGAMMTACTIKNPFREWARTLLQQLERYPRWNHEQFAQAAADFKGRHPSPAGLWEALVPSGPSGPLIRPLPGKRSDQEFLA